MPVAAQRTISRTLKTLTVELRDECLRSTKLINQLESEDLGEDQREDILGELTVSVTHLMTQAKIVKEEIED